MDQDKLKHGASYTHNEVGRSDRQPFNFTWYTFTGSFSQYPGQERSKGGQTQSHQFSGVPLILEFYLNGLKTTEPQAGQRLKNSL